MLRKRATEMAGEAASGNGNGRLDPAALSVEDAARVLSRLGGRTITAAMLAADLESGAPANPDGSLNLVHYAAWLVREMNAQGRGRAAKDGRGERGGAGGKVGHGD